MRDKEENDLKKKKKKKEIKTQRSKENETTERKMDRIDQVSNAVSVVRRIVEYRDPSIRIHRGDEYIFFFFSSKHETLFMHLLDR